MAGDALQDGSKRFVLRGGPADGIVVRLFPHNDGWDTFNIMGHTYDAPYPQDAKKPFMQHVVPA